MFNTENSLLLRIQNGDHSFLTISKNKLWDPNEGGCDNFVRTLSKYNLQYQPSMVLYLNLIRKIQKATSKNPKSKKY